MAKNFDTISNNLIIKNNLLKLNLHILVLGYVEDRLSYFIEIIRDENEDKKNKTINYKSSILKKKK